MNPCFALQSLLILFIRKLTKKLPLFRRKKKCVRYLQGEDSDCKDGKCDADGDHHKPSCPAAHEPGCSVRGNDACDCNTHTCGGEFGGEKVKVEEKESCTCRKETEKTPTPTDKDPGKDTLHLASVANLSLTRETSVTSVANTSLPTMQDSNSLFKTENVFTTPKFRSGFEQATSQAAATNNQPRVFLATDFSSVTAPNTSTVSMLSHFPSS